VKKKRKRVEGTYLIRKWGVSGWGFLFFLLTCKPKVRRKNKQKKQKKLVKN
jgi:hypothetical protein